LCERAKDAKTVLQEWAQAQGLEPPVYRTTAQQGPSHAPAFEIEVRLKGVAPTSAAGSSKRKAQQAAAEALLIREGVWSDDRA
ncbi:MAG: putative dsRNA-binding protein, partial [Pseudomonadota bacterium]